MWFRTMKTKLHLIFIFVFYRKNNCWKALIWLKQSLPFVLHFSCHFRNKSLSALLLQYNHYFYNILWDIQWILVIGTFLWKVLENNALNASFCYRLICDWYLWVEKQKSSSSVQVTPLATLPSMFSTTGQKVGSQNFPSLKIRYHKWLAFPK